MLWFVIILIVAALLLYIKLSITYNYWKRRGIPYDVPIPPFGMMHDLIFGRKSFIDSLDDIYRDHPNARYVGYYQFTKPILFLRDPDLIKQICVKDFDVFPERRTNIPEEIEPLWTKNLVAVNATKWRNLRPVMSPAFTSSKLKIIFSQMDQCARQFCNHFMSQNSNQIEVELKDIFTRYANDVIASTAFGLKIDSLKDVDNEFYVMGKKFANFEDNGTLKFFLYDVLETPMKWLDIKILPKAAVAYFNKLLKEATKRRVEENIVRPDVLHLLLQARKNEGRELDITDKDIAAQAMIFFLGGFETVSTALCFTIYELALNSDAQRRLQKEIDIAWKEENGEITFDVISRMKYLDMVVSESLRKNPPMLLVDRKAVKSYTIEPANAKETPLHIKTGQLCTYSIYSLHKDEKFFPNPNKFDPERFNDDNKQTIHPGAYVPFGVGPRNCIGSRFSLIEIKTLVFHVIRNFEIVPNEKTEIPLEMLKDRFVPVTANGFQLSFKKRIAWL